MSQMLYAIKFCLILGSGTQNNHNAVVILPQRYGKITTALWQKLYHKKSVKKARSLQQQQKKGPVDFWHVSNIIENLSIEF